MNVLKILSLLFLASLSFSTANSAEHQPFKMPEIQVIPVQDAQTDRQYELYVKLPRNYSKDKQKQYPAVYFTDAEGFFELVSANSRLLGPVILVGISYEKDMGWMESRSRDYSPAKIEEWDEKTGEAKNHLTFIKNDVVNYVDTNFRTLPDQRTYVGFSLGALFGAYILMEAPDTFNSYILGSPALGYVKPYMVRLEQEASLKRKDINANVYISVGGQESETEYLKPIEKFVSNLKSRNYRSLKLHHEVIQSVDHDEGRPISLVHGMYWLRHLNKE